MGAWAEKRIFDLDGGRLSLEFTNTMSGLRVVKPHERITEYADLACTMIRNGYLNGETVRLDGAIRMAPR